MTKAIIKKMGGENSANIFLSTQNIVNEKNIQAVVVSAMRSKKFNTTDNLILLGKAIAQKNKQKVNEIFSELLYFHKFLLEKNNLAFLEKELEVYFNDLKLDIDFNLEKKEVLPNKENDYLILSRSGQKYSLLGWGEKIAATILAESSNHFLNGKKVVAVDLGNIVNMDQSASKDDNFNFLTKKVGKIVDDLIKKGLIPIIGGYVGLFNGGIEKAIGRGYSDATAAIVGVGLSNLGYEVVIEIQKTVKGLLSADPRLLENPSRVKILKEVDYLIAREITGDNGAQAKLLHYQTLRPEVQDANIKIHLFDPFSDGDGTWIVPKIGCKQKSGGVDFVGGRKNVYFFSISSGKMFEKAILARLFKIVAKYYSVDIISASETEVSFTVDGNQIDSFEELNKMIWEIRKEFNIPKNSLSEFVEYKNEKALIFCVGACIKNNVKILGEIAQILGENGINIELVSQGRLQRAIVLGISQDYFEKAVNLLHEKLICNR